MIARSEPQSAISAVCERWRSSLTARVSAVKQAVARNRRVAALELGGTVAFVLVYFLLRGLRPPDVEESVRRSLEIVRFEQQLGVFWEATWQAAIIESRILVTIANFVYAWLHFPVLGILAVWLVFRDLDRFRFLRNVLVVSALIGIVAYWVLPAAPPRLLEVAGYDFGFVDTVHGEGSNAHYFQPGPFVNDYAAVPSFHFGWIALASAAIWVSTSGRFWKAVAILLSAAMWWAVVVTGNHFFFDMVFGAVVVAGSWAIVGWLHRRDYRPLRRALLALVPFRSR